MLLQVLFHTEQVKTSTRSGEEVLRRSRCSCWFVACFHISHSILIIYLPFLQFVVILLCAENSFWHISKSSSFVDAFQQAFKSYVKIETAVEALGHWPYTANEQETYQSKLLSIILDHRLRMSNPY